MKYITVEFSKRNEKSLITLFKIGMRSLEKS